jgi:hypothetical protein
LRGRTPSVGRLALIFMAARTRMPRSRTGCLTCRHRKVHIDRSPTHFKADACIVQLKCSEERPVCAQCVKANRECIPSTGITFRHQQNPSMNHADHGEGSLKSFYGYKETFAKETTWVPLPSQLTFVHTNNPYDDEEDDSGYVDHDGSLMPGTNDIYTSEGHGKIDYEFARELAQAAYPQMHGLEALSAVATQDQYSYAPPPAPMTQSEHSSHQHFSTAGHQEAHSNTSQNLEFILNPTSAGAANNSNIDPRLHSDVPVSQPSFDPPHSSPENVSSSFCSVYRVRLLTNVRFLPQPLFRNTYCELRISSSTSNFQDTHSPMGIA